MQIITTQGIKEFEKTFDSKKVQGTVTNIYLTFRPKNTAALNKIIWACRDKQLEYNILNEEVVTISQEVLTGLLPSSCFEEKRVWKGKDQYFLCSEMDHQRLSNCVGLLDLMLKKGKINKKKSEDYLSKLYESIVPELEERFNGEILDYIPYYEWEKEMVKLPDTSSK